MNSSLSSSPNSIRLADGTQIVPGDVSWNQVTWTDANGNSRVDNSDGWTDTLGRKIVTIQTGTNQRIYQVYDSGGTQRSFTLNLGTINLATQSDFNVSGDFYGTVRSYTATQTVINSIVLPNGKLYQFQYENGTYGGLTRIDFPTGAYVTYTWATYSAGARTFRYVASRTLNVEGKSFLWSFSRPYGGPVTVNDPDNNQSVYNVGDNGALYSASFYQGTTAGTLLRRYQIDYTSDADPWDDHSSEDCPSPVQEVAIRPIRVTTTLDDNSATKTEYDYETFTYTYHQSHLGHITSPVSFTTSRGNVTQVRQYAYGSGSAGALLRQSSKSYLHTGNTAYLNYNVINKVSQEIIYDGSGTQKAKTDYEYDTTSLTSRTGVPQHDDVNYPASFLNRGNLSKVKRWRNTPSVTLTTTYNYDSLGNLLSVSDPLGHATAYNYADSWYNSPSGCLPSSNSYAYASQVTNAAGQSRWSVYYPCTGLVQAKKDQNDADNSRSGTTFTHDFMNRLLVASYPDGGQSTNVYADTPPAKVTTTTKINSSTNRTTEVEADGLGRPRVTRLTSDPQGTIYTRVGRDGYGRAVSSWNPSRTNPDTESNCAGSAIGCTQTQFDGLGRLAKEIPPDGSSTSNNVTYLYSGAQTTVTDQAGKSRRSVTDALGRLTQVVEDPGNSNLATSYSYDTLDNLTTVTQGSQTRTFVYDSLSQLTDATNPESGHVIYAYNDDGMLASRTNALSAVTSYGYDNLHRLTGKTYTAANTPNVTYTYDNLSASCNSKGRLTSVSSSDSTTSSLYFDSMGRITQSSQATNGNTYAFSNYGYDYLGNLISQTLPSGKVIKTEPARPARGQSLSIDI
jgi:YD repeat-containing protein